MSIFTAASYVFSSIWNFACKTGENNVKNVKGKIPIHVGYLYAFETGKNKFKVGKTIDLRKRIKPYRTLMPNGDFVHTVKCKNLHTCEKILHNLLISNGHHIEKEIFMINEETLINYMNMVVLLEDNLHNKKGFIQMLNTYLRSI